MDRLSNWNTDPIRWWARVGASSIRCELCPHHCTLHEGETGRCGVRRCGRGSSGLQMEIPTRNQISSLCVDPMEKKPLFHFYPGESILSVGGTGCNLSCSFCQNWQISKISPQNTNPHRVQNCPADRIAEIAIQSNCRHVALTYNEPIVRAEYGMEVAHVCRSRGLRTVAVTNGSIDISARADFFREIDAANVDLKSIRDSFYRQYCGASLEPVLETLRYLVRETEIWLEITNLIIPQANDDADELRQLSTWIVEELGPEIPVHFSAFRPMYLLTDRPPTPPETLERAYEIATQAGLQYVYTGNIFLPDSERTQCPQCGDTLIERRGFTLKRNRLQGDFCPHCHHRIAGRFRPSPTNDTVTDRTSSGRK